MKTEALRWKIAEMRVWACLIEKLASRRVENPRVVEVGALVSAGAMGKSPESP
jgi:hypothetical protein